MTNLDSYPRLKEALGKFSQDYYNRRYQCLYEADVQVLLSKHLEKEFHEEHFVSKYHQHKKNVSIEQVDKFNIGKVHREYPAKILFDNVVLGAPKRYEEIENKSHKYEAFWMQPIWFAIELKFVPLYGNTTLFADASYDDYYRMIEKIKNVDDKQLKLALQLTCFQSIEDQEAFLRNHDKNYRKRYCTELQNMENIIATQNSSDYLYLNLKTKSIQSVFPIL